jgi:hypothetical protein
MDPRSQESYGVVRGIRSVSSVVHRPGGCANTRPATGFVVFESAIRAEPAPDLKAKADTASRATPTLGLPSAPTGHKPCRWPKAPRIVGSRMASRVLDPHTPISGDCGCTKTSAARPGARSARPARTAREAPRPGVDQQGHTPRPASCASSTPGRCSTDDPHRTRDRTDHARQSSVSFLNQAAILWLRLSLIYIFAQWLIPVPFAQDSPAEYRHDPDNDRHDLYPIDNARRGPTRGKHNPTKQLSNSNDETRGNPYIFPPTQHRSLRRACHSANIVGAMPCKIGSTISSPAV